MFGEIVNSIKANLYERIVSPLSGAFLIALLLSNYETVLLIFDSQDYYQKISFISASLYPDVEAAIWKLFGLPAIYSVAFIVLYPWPSRWAYQYWMGQQKRLKEIKVKIENETPLTIQESRELRRQLTVLEDQFNTELRQKEKENEELKASIIQLENEKVDLRSSIEQEINSSLSQNQERSNTKAEKKGQSEKYQPVADVARNNDELAENDGGEGRDFIQSLSDIDSGENLDAFFKGVGSSSSGGDSILRYMPHDNGLSLMRTEHIAKALEKIGFASVYTDEEGDQMFSLTEKGKKFLLDHGYA